MIELEAKVWLTKKGISPKVIKGKLEKEFVFLGAKTKKDQYYSLNGKDDLIFRIREQNGVCIVTQKVRSRDNGFEVNEETEFIVDNKTQFATFVSNLGYENTFKKTKTTRDYKSKSGFDGFVFELTKCEQLGHFLEIEILCKNKDELVHNKKLLVEAFSLFGFSQKDFEKKLYIELLLDFEKSK